MLAVVLAITAVAAPVGLHVRNHLKPRLRRPRLGQRQGPGANRTGVRGRSREQRVGGHSAPDPVRDGERTEEIIKVEEKLRCDGAVVAVLDASSTHNPAMVARDRRSTYVLSATRPLSDEQQEATGKRLLAAFAGDPRVTLGGNPVANDEISKTIENDLRRAELLAVPLIVLLSFFIFRGSVASLLAPIAGAITVIVSFFLLRELASVTSLSIYALNLVTGLSIGLSIDWSLLLLSRYRMPRPMIVAPTLPRLMRSSDSLRYAARRSGEDPERSPRMGRSAMDSSGHETGRSHCRGGAQCSRLAWRPTSSCLVYAHRQQRLGKRGALVHDMAAVARTCD